MASDFNIKKGDRNPSIQSQLLDSTGVAVNLAGCTVKFRMRALGASGSPKVYAAASVSDAPNGKVLYAWQAADVDTVGLYQAEWEVTDGSGKVQCFPADGYMAVEVESTLN